MMDTLGGGDLQRSEQASTAVGRPGGAKTSRTPIRDAAKLLGHGMVWLVNGFRPEVWRRTAKTQCQEQLEMFASVRSIARLEPDRLTPAVSKLLMTQREFVVSEEAIRRLGTRFFGLLALGIVAAAPSLVGLWFHVQVLASLQEVLGYGFAICILAGVAGAPFLVVSKAFLPYGVAYVWLTGWSFAYLVAVYALLHSKNGSHGWEGFVATAIAYEGMIVAFFGYFGLAIPLQRHCVKAWQLQHPDAAVLLHLIVILKILEDCRQNLGPGTTGAETSGVEEGTSAEISGTLLGLLSQASDILRQALPRILNPYRPDSTYVGSTVSQIAAGLQGLRPSLLLAAGGPSRDDMERVGNYLSVWVLGGVSDWRALGEDSEPVEDIKPRRKLSRTGLVLGIAAVPLVTILVLRVVPWQGARQVGELIPLGVAWLLTVGGSLLEPLTKSNAVQSAFSLTKDLRLS